MGIHTCFDFFVFLEFIIPEHNVIFQSLVEELVELVRVASCLGLGKGLIKVSRAKHQSILLSTVPNLVFVTCACASASAYVSVRRVLYQFFVARRKKKFVYTKCRPVFIR